MEVEPIREPKKIEAMVQFLRGGPDGHRDALLFVFGINTALRVGDLLKLNLGDVVDSKGHIKDGIILKEGKTGKTRKCPLNNSVQKALKEYLDARAQEGKTMALESPLFLSRTGDKAITRQRAHQILSSAGESIGLHNIGTHTLRKTFGYHVYQSSGDLALVQKILNHNESETTLRYIGINREVMDKTFRELNLGL
jgi:site-specific recombinase XerD